MSDTLPRTISELSDDLEFSTETATIAVENFSLMHPNIRMNYTEWADLKECIEREIRGHLDPASGIGSADLVEEQQRTGNR